MGDVTPAASAARVRILDGPVTGGTTFNPTTVSAAMVLCTHASGAGHYRPEDEHCPWVTAPIGATVEPVPSEEVPRGFRRWWVKPFRSTDDSDWPFIHSVGIKGRFRHKFFSLSLAWGTKKARTW